MTKRNITWILVPIVVLGIGALLFNRSGSILHNTFSAKDQNVLAQTVETIAENNAFKLADYTDVEFNMTRVAVARGGVSVPTCSAEGKLFISIQIPYQATPGNCIPAETKNGITPAVLFINMEIKNSSKNGFGGEFINVIYTNATSGETVIQKALANPLWGAIKVDPTSARTIPMGFIIPDDVKEVSIVYGNYADKNGKHFSGNDLERTEGGYIVNLEKKTITNIPG